MGVGICSNPTPVFQPQKFNISTIGSYDTDRDRISQISDIWSSKRVLVRNPVILYKSHPHDRIKQCGRRKHIPKHKMRKQMSDTWSSKTVSERDAVIFYKSYSQDQCDRRKYVPKHKMRKSSQSSIKGPTFGRRSQGLLLNREDRSSSNYDILDGIWIATQEAQRKDRGNSGTITTISNRLFDTEFSYGESTDECAEAFSGEDFDVKRRSRGKSSFSPSIENESYIQKNVDGRLLKLMFYASDSSDSFDTS